MDDQGFIKLSRKFFKNPLWKEPRQYSRSEAWLDLIFMARFEDSKQILRNRVIEVQRGEIIASRRFLEERWMWGSTKVINFLNYLQVNGMINQRQTAGQTIIKLCNYEAYNASQTSDYDKNKPVANQWQTSDKPVTNQNKEYKESKEREKYNIPPLSPNGDISPGDMYDNSENEIPDNESKQPKKEKEKSSAKKEKEPNYSFEEFWDAYDKKVGKKESLIKKWLKLSDEERELAMSYILKYKQCQPDKQYRKNPETFLNNKSWNDELIFRDQNEHNTAKQGRSPNYTESDFD